MANMFSVLLFVSFSCFSEFGTTIDVHIKQNTTYRNGYGVSSKQTTTYIYDGDVSSKQTTTHIEDDGVSSKQTQTYIDDGGVSPEQTMTYRNGCGVSSKQTPTYIDDGDVSSKQTTTHIEDDGVSSNQTPTYIDDDGVSSKQTTTYIYDGGVPSEQTTKFMDDYGLSLKTTVGKKKYMNRMKCEIMNLTDIVLPSASGRVYPVNKSSQSLLIWFDDFSYLSLTISKNCVSLALDMFLDIIIDVAYLQDFLTKCPDKTFSQDILCDSTLAYNVSYIKDVFPHFSNVQIYFIDKLDHCTAQFNAFLESETHLLTNAEIYHFLTNKTICWKYVYFTYILNVKFSLKDLSDDRNTIKTGSLSKHTSKAEVYIILQHQACQEQFLHYIYWNGLHVKENDTYLLSLDNIITFNEENNCIHVRGPCPDRYIQAALAFPKSAVVYLETAIAVEVTLVNGVMLYIFLQKKNRTPVTLLLSALAISDTTVAILMTIPTCIAFQIYGHQMDYRDIMPVWYIFDYPQCIMYLFLDELKFTFHFVSVLITTLLCLQKTAALLFPMWSKRHLSNTVSVVCSVCIVIFCFGIFTPILYSSFLMEEVQGSCCRKSSVIYPEVYTYLYTIVYGCTILACLIVIVFTVYIVCKLTIFRRNLPWTDSLAVQKRNRISASTVVLICIIFVVSESVSIVAFSHFTLMLFDINSALPFYLNIKQYVDLSLILGFSLNFIIYIVMSREFRNKLWITVTNIVRCCKCW